MTIISVNPDSFSIRIVVISQVLFIETISCYISLPSIDLVLTFTTAENQLFIHCYSKNDVVASTTVDIVISVHCTGDNHINFCIVAHSRGSQSVRSIFWLCTIYYIVTFTTEDVIAGESSDNEIVASTGIYV